jgi:hypothetical protein
MSEDLDGNYADMFHGTVLAFVGGPEENTKTQ